MKVLLTGASGLVGQAALQAALERGHEVLAVGQSRRPPLPAEAAAKEQAHAVQADLTDDAVLERLVFDFYPEAIINAAAASSQTVVEKDPALAEKINVELPRRLAQLGHHLSARFLQISTDMVFDGEGGPYRSTDVPMPRTLYGQLKLMAEKETLRFGSDFVVVLRIALVNGNSPSGQRSVHEKLFHAWAAGQVTPLLKDELRQPVSAVNVGEVLTELLERPNLHGLFHWAGPDTLSRYEIGRAVLEHFGLPEHLIRETSAADEPGLESRSQKLELVLPPLLGKLKAQPTPFAQQLEELRVPAECAEWHRQMSAKSSNGQGASATAEPRRLVRGRDF
ncbi:MAG: SDR family oxidoreductase [Opitutales bacterium]|jgi:dTDP-4-dehydrorhamnose reductase